MTPAIDISIARGRVASFNSSAAAGAPVISKQEQRSSSTRPKSDFQCYGGALELWAAVLRGEPQVMLHGPAETGKTIAALHLVDHLCWTYPKLQGAIIRKVAQDLWGSVIHDFESKVLKFEDGKSPHGVTKYGGEKPEFYTYPNGSKIWVGGLDHPGKILSAQRDFVYTNQTEEFDQNDWETISTRTTGRGGVLQPGRLFGDCNPGPSTHWIMALNEAKTLLAIKSRHKDNPTLYDPITGEITAQGRRSMDNLQKLTGVRYKRLFAGLWVAAEGVVYEKWDPTTHAGIPQPWSEITRHVVGVDWGLTNPGVFQVWGVDGDGRMYRRHEVYMTGKLVGAEKPADAWWVARAKEIQEKYNPEMFVADPSRPEHILALQTAGIPCVGAYNDVEIGVQHVQDRLELKDDHRPRICLLAGSKPEKDPHLLEKHLPTCLEEEIEVYAYPKDSIGKAKKENPKDENNHGCDAMRYAVCYVDGLGKNQFMFGRTE